MSSQSKMGAPTPLKNLLDTLDGPHNVSGRNCDKSNSTLCCICLEDVDEEEAALLNTWCPSSKMHEGPANTHMECFMAMISNRIMSAFPGSCPSILCPCLHSGSEGQRDHVIPYACWAPHASADLKTQYRHLCENLLLFLCSNCHCQKTCLLRHTSTDHPVLHTEEYQTFIHYKLSLESFYNFVMRNRPPAEDMAGGGEVNDEAWNYFFPILQAIEDPALRANLHLRFYRSFPSFRTSCCRMSACFSCKSAAHVGKTCQVNLGGNCDNDIIECPRCGIALTKGDGCDAVVCVCRANLSWSLEKKNKALIGSFTNLYPQNTSDHCACIVYDSWALKSGPSSASSSSTAPSGPSPTVKHASAEAYRRRYHSDVNTRLIRLWVSKHGYDGDKVNVDVDKVNGKVKDYPSATSRTLSLAMAERLLPSLASAKQLVNTCRPHPCPLDGQLKSQEQHLPPFARACGMSIGFVKKETANPPTLWALYNPKDTQCLYLNELWGKHVHTQFDSFFPREEDKADAVIRLFSVIAHKWLLLPETSPFGEAIMVGARRWYSDPSNRQKIDIALYKCNTRLVQQFLFRYGSARVSPCFGVVPGLSAQDTTTKQQQSLLDSGGQLIRTIIERLWFSNRGRSDNVGRSARAFMHMKYIDEKADAFEKRALELLKRFNSDEDKERVLEDAALAITSSCEFRSVLTDYAHVVDERPSDPRIAASHLGSCTPSSPKAAPAPPRPRYMPTALVSTTSIHQGAAQLNDTYQLRYEANTLNNHGVTGALLRRGAAALRRTSRERSSNSRDITLHRYPSSPDLIVGNLDSLSSHNDDNDSRSPSPEVERRVSTDVPQDPLQLTWSDLWDATWWAVRFRSRASVRHFKSTHGANACGVAARLLSDSSLLRDERAVALDFSRTYHKEMDEWYRHDAESKDPLIDAQRGCRCVPRHKSRNRSGRSGRSCTSFTWIRARNAPQLTPKQVDRALQQQEEEELATNPYYLGCYGTTACQRSLFSWIRLYSGRRTSSDLSCDTNDEASHEVEAVTASALTSPSRFVHCVLEPTGGERSRLTPEFPLPPGMPPSPRAQLTRPQPPPRRFIPPPPPRLGSHIQALIQQIGARRRIHEEEHEDPLAHFNADTASVPSSTTEPEAARLYRNHIQERNSRIYTSQPNSRNALLEEIRSARHVPRALPRTRTTRTGSR